MSVLPEDMLYDCFKRQNKFMELLRDNDKMPEYPVDLTTKMGQRLIKETVFNCIEEMCEASFTLKNRMHRLTDDKTLDVQHYKEELGDAFAFLLEIFILSGFSADDLYEEYCRKNKVVTERLARGY